MDGNELIAPSPLDFVFNNDSLTEMILNSLAMEFLMNLDNEFEEIYFKFLPEAPKLVAGNLLSSI